MKDGRWKEGGEVGKLGVGKLRLAGRGALDRMEGWIIADSPKRALL
jgi:hypothetical protein